ncbi:hypothetical protein D3C84_1191570 [compost metagenome]
MGFTCKRDLYIRRERLMKEKVITQTNMSEKVIDKVFVVSKNKFHPEEETLL